MADSNQHSNDDAPHIAGAREKFSRSFKEHGPSIDALQWASKESATGRFAVLAEIGDLSDKSVLDVGCGFADLADFLEEIYEGVRYTGVEVVDGIAQAARARRLDLEIVTGSIDALESDRRWDYVMQSGIFNVAYYDFAAMEAMLRDMFERADIGVATNFLSKLSTGKFNLDAAYYAPADIVSLASKLTRRFELRHHYRDNDFTLYLYKDDEHPGTETRPGEIDAPGVRRPKP